MSETKSYTKYFFEFLSIFIGITLAFTLENWNSNRKDRLQERKILTEIRNGLELDLSDLSENKNGHYRGMQAIHFFRRAIQGEDVNQDSLAHVFNRLTRDFIAVQNKTGYETLKSQGLELIENDSLRFEIIKLYDFNYQIIEKLEERYEEIQFFRNYFDKIFENLYPHMNLTEQGTLVSFKKSLKLSTAEYNKIQVHLRMLERNRFFIHMMYKDAESNIHLLIRRIDRYLEEN